MKKISKRFTTLLSHAAAIAALLFFLLSVLVYSFESSIVYRLCGSFFYSEPHIICTIVDGKLVYLAKFLLSGTSLILALLILLTTSQNRRRFIWFLALVIPVSAVVLIASYFIEFCFMYSCSNVLPLGIRLVISLWVLGFLVLISWSLFKGREYLIVILMFSLCLAVGLINHYARLYDLQDKDLQGLRASPRSTEDCSAAYFLAERDKCLFNYSIRNASTDTCAPILSKELRSSCVAFILSNRAVAGLDASACQKVSVPQQRELCISLIRERLEYINLHRPR